jgi:hypothetical protein
MIFNVILSSDLLLILENLHSAVQKYTNQLMHNKGLFKSCERNRDQWWPGAVDH